MLTCSCDDDWDGEGWVYYDNPLYFQPFNLPRRRRCVSCKELINQGDECLEFKRIQYPQNEVQIRIYGGEDAEIMLAPYYVCAKCGEIYLNLFDSGYECMVPSYGMQKYLDEYHDLTGWKPGKGPGPKLNEAAA